MNAIIGIVLFAIIIAAAILYVTVYLPWARRNASGVDGDNSNSDFEEISYFECDPFYLCPTPNCKTNIRYKVKTNQTETTATLKIVGPNNQEQVVSNDLELDITELGNSQIWFDGAGIYTFELTISGNIIGTSTIRRNVTILNPTGGSVSTNRTVYLGSDLSDMERYSALERFNISNIFFSTQKSNESLCSKYMHLNKITYSIGLGFPSGYPKEIFISFFNASTEQIYFEQNLSEGGTANFQNGIELDDNIGVSWSTATGYNTITNVANPPYPMGTSISIVLIFDFVCIQ